MNKLLITSALVAVATAAAAETSLTGSFELGYNDYSTDAENAGSVDGFAVDSDIAIGGSSTLDDGTTVTAGFGINVDYVGESGGATGTSNVSADDFPSLKVESSAYTLTIDQGGHAAEAMFDGPAYGALVGFTEGDEELIARVDTKMGGMSAGLSYTIYDATTVTGISADTVEGTMTAALAGDFSGVSFSAAYEQSGNDAIKSIMGVSAGYTVAGATLTLAYAGQDDATTMGVDLAYEINGWKVSAGVTQNDTGVAGADPYMGYGVKLVGDVTGLGVTAEYEADDSTANGNSSWSLDLAYTISSVGVQFGAEQATVNGTAGDTELYAVTSYDLGGGASVYARYATEAEIDPDEDAIDGVAIGVAFAF